MIRRAALEDLPSIVEVGEKFHAASALADVSTFDPAFFAETMARYIEDRAPFRAGVFVWGREPQGVIAGAVYPSWFNGGQLTGMDLFWWLEPEARNFKTAKAMLDRLEDWAKGEGAVWFTMAATETLRPDAVEALYRRRGYVPAERHLIRKL